MNRRQKRKSMFPKVKLTQILPNGKKIRHYSLPKDEFKIFKYRQGLINQYENANYVVKLNGVPSTNEEVSTFIEALKKEKKHETKN